MNLSKISAIILCSFFIAANTIKSQDFNPEHISISNGLSNVEVATLFQDSYGFLWVGTVDGLNQYDGYKFKVFKNVPGNTESLIDNDVRKIIEDKNKNLWIATAAGVSMLDRKTNKFKNYDLEKFSNNPANQTAGIIIDSENNIWVEALGAGLLKFNNTLNSFEQFFPDSLLLDKISRLGIIIATVEHKKKFYFSGIGKGFFTLDLVTNKLEELKLGDKKTYDFSNENITNLFIDQKEILWIISEDAFYKYDMTNNNFKEIKNYKDDRVFWVWRLNTGFIQDLEGNIWIGKDMRGLYKFDGISDDYSQIPFGTEYDNRKGVYTQTITSMIVDNSGIIWIGTFNDGLYKHDPSKKPFKHFTHDPSNPNSISGNEIFGLAESKKNKNNIYVGIRGGGLNIFNPETETFKNVNINFKDDMFGGSVRSILEYKDELYLGTWGDGLFKLDSKGKLTLVSKYDPSDYNSISDNLIRVLAKDAFGKIWIGGNQGLNIYNPSTNILNQMYSIDQFHYPQELIDLIREKTSKNESLCSILKVPSSQNLSKNFSIEKPREFLIVSAGEADDSSAADYGWLEDSNGKIIWNLSDKKEFYHLQGADKNVIDIDVIKLLPGKYKLHYKSDDSHAYGDWNARAPIDSSLWGIQILNLTDQQITVAKTALSQSKSQVKISGENIRSIHISSNNIVWIGTDQGGLNKYDQNSNTIKYYKFDPKNKNSLSNNNVQFIHEDKKGILWLATNYGLNRFDPKTEIFTVYTEEDGLPTNYVASILEDEKNNLWIATRNGLSRLSFEGSRPLFVNYDAKDGLGGSDFIALVALKSSAGKFYFGGEHGLNEFEPGIMNSSPPRSIITDIKISNRSISYVDEGSYLTESIYDTKEIILPFDKNDLSFEFSALHFGRADKNQYGHFLEGDDENWVYDNRRFTSYTNLSPGEYVFHAKGSNSDGVWDTAGTSIKIIITPPWYLTTFAYIGYFLIAAGGIYGFDRFQRKRLLSKERTANSIREAELRAQAAELQAKAAEAQNRAIQIENERKTKELEEARDLQLSMLPKNLPALPNLDIAVYMKTATEVGGDYYDFNVGIDGTLTVVIGDATGHGMKAGTMVTAAKTLFNSYSANPDIVYTFHEMTRCIKQLQMQSVSMCLTMLKIQSNKLFMSSAGMPPMFLFKRENRIVEEHLLKGMPLGAMNNFPYELKEMELAIGDTILLMSDGFPELVNENDELYGYKRVRNKFEEVAEKEPEEIISYLKNDGSIWVNNNDPDDDVTFVVIKVK
ncbi:MAG: SpoIIE family protein phosphatase [Bacteroidetes bacterium]|nr:SpoIIE family protein phosphatase [Bacteroidota bacterium]